MLLALRVYWAYNWNPQDILNFQLVKGKLSSNFVDLTSFLKLEYKVTTKLQHAIQKEKYFLCISVNLLFVLFYD